ncbi:MAG: hypothetical protein AAFY38_02710 [Pseudomonadota bacterium]
MSRKDRRARRQDRRKNRRNTISSGLRNIGSSVRDTAAEARERAEAARARAEAAARRAAAEARRRAEDARRRAEDARRRAEEAAAEARARAEEARERAEAAADEVREGGRRFVDSIKPRVRDVGADIAEYLEDLPAREEGLVRRGERALVIFSEFNEQSEQTVLHNRLYGFAEKTGVSMATGMLGRVYDCVLPVTGANATLAELIDTMRDILDERYIAEIDLLWHGHGLDPTEKQQDYTYSMAPDPDSNDSGQKTGNVTLTAITDAIDDLDADDRLRMFYTTACYGADLAEGMVDAGFSCGAGARAVNTNATLEYPHFLKGWGMMRPFDRCVRDALARSRYRKIDAQISKMSKDGRFSDTDSFKELFGDTAINIRSNADF